MKIVLTSLAAAAVFLLVSSLPTAYGQELVALGGGSKAPSIGKTTYSWQLSYRAPLQEHLSWGLSYLNEGHFPSHHRDGYAPQIWAHAPLFHDALELSAGIGPYYYLDTVSGAVPGLTSRNRHGVKALTSLGAAWYSEKNFFLKVQGNYLTLGDNVDSFSALAGVGYRFSPPHRGETGRTPPAAVVPDNEVTLMMGQTIVNSVRSSKSVAAAVEYRRRVVPHLEGTLAFLFEGDHRLIRRDGLMAQIWATDDLLNDRLGVGIGGGVHLNLQTYRKKRERLSGVITMTGCYRISRRINLRTSWNRIVTNYDRDTDVIVAGIGYLF